MKNKFYVIPLILVIVLLAGCECNDPEPEVYANFTFTKDESDFLKVTFTNLSKNFVSLSWNFGDGSGPSTEENPIHTFPDAGSFTVKLTATGKDGKISEKEETIVIVSNIKIFTLQPDGTDGKDASLASCIPCGYHSTNYGSTTDFVITAWTNNGDPSNIRGLLQFDLSTIPTDATIVSAKLSLYYKNSPGNGDHSGSNEAYLQKVTSSWDESTITWDTQPSVTTVDQVSLAQSTTTTQDYTDIDISTFVQGWVQTPASNFGLLMRMQIESPYRQLAFASSDYTDASKHPKLVIEYK